MHTKGRRKLPSCSSAHVYYFTKKKRKKGKNKVSTWCVEFLDERISSFSQAPRDDVRARHLSAQRADMIEKTQKKISRKNFSVQQLRGKKKNKKKKDRPTPRLCKKTIDSFEVMCARNENKAAAAAAALSP